MKAIRFTSTVVFPLPAPARTRTGPSVVNTALHCSGLRREPYTLSKSARFAFKNSFLRSFCILSPKTGISLPKLNAKLPFFGSSAAIRIIFVKFTHLFLDKLQKIRFFFFRTASIVPPRFNKIPLFKGRFFHFKKSFPQKLMLIMLKTSCR